MISDEELEEIRKGRERWLDMQKTQINLLKRIAIDSETQAQVLIELLSKSKDQAFKETAAQYREAWKKNYQSLNDWLFQEHGEIDLKDILPPAPNNTEEGE